MARPKKCPVCGEYGKEEDMILIGDRWYHKGECEKVKSVEKQKAQHYKDLVQYLCNLCKATDVNPIWMASIKKLKEQYNFTDRGIMLTLKYYFEILGNRMDNEDFLLSIVPYYYNKARDFWIEQQTRKKNMYAFLQQGKQFVRHEKVVIKNKPTKTEINRERERRYIDISSL